MVDILAARSRRQDEDSRVIQGVPILICRAIFRRYLEMRRVGLCGTSGIDSKRKERDDVEEQGQRDKHSQAPLIGREMINPGSEQFQRLPNGGRFQEKVVPVGFSLGINGFQAHGELVVGIWKLGLGDPGCVAITTERR